MARLVEPMPSVDGIQDLATRRALRAIIANMNAWSGAGRDGRGRVETGHRLPDVEEMQGTGLMLLDLRGRLRKRKDAHTAYIASQTVVVAAGGYAVSTSKFEQYIITPSLDASAGLAIGSHSMGASLPLNARITYAWYTVLDTFQSATDAAVIQIGVDDDDEAGIVEGVAISDSDNPWDAGNHLGIPTPRDADSFTTKATAARDIVAVVSGEALTAGRLTMIVFYEVIP